MINATNIEEKLRELNAKKRHQPEVLQEVYHILNAVEGTVPKTSIAVKEKSSSTINQFVFDVLETERIFHIDQIRTICIDYRLRFLDSKLFKAKIPDEALEEIARLEEMHTTTLKGLKVMAPSKLFYLEDKDDPLLFAPIGNGYYYLIHKWGNDLHPLRKLLVWPFKDMLNLIVTILVFSYLTTLLVPLQLFSKNDTGAEFWMMFFFVFKAITAIVIFYGFALGKNFNPAIWNSKYYNA